ncbi:MAG: Ca2+-binding EF-hand superfamily protein [Arenicella sp.]|jgi:Ca2+-binding EF-hand superfamily protein
MKHPFLLSLSTCLVLLLSSPVFAHEHGAKGHKQGKAEAMFDQTDANQDGQLELTEFLAHAEQRFKSMDLNQDGYVNKEEGRDAHRQMREKRKQERKQYHKQRNSEQSETE